jgi:hypothetical protein
MRCAGEGRLVKEGEPNWRCTLPQSAQKLGFKFGVFGSQFGELGSFRLAGFAGGVCRAQAIKV